MKIYRIAKKRFINDLSGEGARLYGGRWNREGDAALYFCEYLSLCVLELLARMDYEFLNSDYWFIEAEIDKKFLEELKNPENISIEWRKNPHISTTQDYGSNWIRQNEKLGLIIPSTILPTEHNIFINPNHESFSKLKILKTAKLNLDERVVS